MSGPTHTCPGGCGRRDVAAGLFACATCWYKLPLELRHPIVRAYRASNDELHQQAMADAFAWYAERAAEDDARPIGTRSRTAGGQVIEWTGVMWKHLTARDLDMDSRRARGSSL